ncbi:MAG: carboxypeptidase regulatory-like domain-containing protein [Terriglobia bacterium]
MKNNVRILGLLIALAFTLAGESLWAATQNALVTGSVYDAAGAPVPGATVRLINAGIGFSQSQPTDDNGTYTFTAVPPAEGYMLSVEMAGFATEIKQDMEVSVGDNKLVLPPFLLQPVAAPAPPPPPAQPTEVAPTPGQPPAQPPTPVKPPAPPPAPARPVRMPSVSLDLVSTTLGGVVDSRSVRTLPLAGRDFLDLTLLLPGTYPVEQGSALQGASIVVNGTRANMNNFLLDGVDNNDYTINQSLPFQIVEAMQEFRVQTSVSAAEYGRSGGAQINTISRSGSNVFHGTLFGFGRNSRLSANNFFSAYNGGNFDQYSRDIDLNNNIYRYQHDDPSYVGTPVPLEDPALASLYNKRRPEVNQIQFGANVGGALKKDKVFGFFNWEGFRVSNPRPVFEQTPPLCLRDNALAASATCYDSPGLTLNPIALNLYNLYPRPYVRSTTANIDPNYVGFFAGESANRTSTENFLGRIDWRKSDRVSMSFKHNLQRIDQTQGGTLPATANYPGNGTGVTGQNQNFSYNLVHQLSPRTTNEFRVGWNRFRLFAEPLDRTVDPATLGLRNMSQGLGLPNLLVGGVFTAYAPYTMLGADMSAPSRRVNSVWSGADNLSITHGRHNVKLGAEARYVRLDVANEAMGRGYLAFYTGAFVARNGTPDVASIARVSPDFGGGFDRSFRSQSYNLFLQDQWRVRSNFTVNLGARYELNTAPVEARDRLVNFYPDLKGLVRANSKTILDPYGFELGTAPTPAPRAGFETDTNNISLHAGFAWDPRNNGKTVFRAGYAGVFDQQPLEPSVNMLLNPPYVEQWFSHFPDVSLGDTFPPGFPDKVLGAGTYFNLDGDGFDSYWYAQPYSITARDPHTQTPYVSQLHGGIQQQLGNRALFEVAYAGSMGRKLPRLRDISPCPGTAFFSDPQTCVPYASSPFLLQTILNQENSARSNFHSLIMRFEVRNLRGLNLRLHYQWAKSIDDASSLQPPVFGVNPLIAGYLANEFTINPDAFFGANNISPTLSLRPDLPVITTRPRLPQDSQNLRGERGRSDFDVRQRLVFNYVYDLPKWARGGRATSGWQVAGITTLQTGQPYSVFLDYLGMPIRPDQVRPATTSNTNPLAAIDAGTPVGFGNPGYSSFSINNLWNPLTGEALLKPGSLGRNTYTGPGIVNFDISLLKNTYLGKGERTNLQFRVEFFNAFNNVNFLEPYSKGGLVFADPVTGYFNGVWDPFFGKILQARAARQIQFGLKLVF